MSDSIPSVHFGGLDVHTAAGTLSDWYLHGFELEERIGEPYSLMLTVSTADLGLSAHGLVGGRCEFHVGRGDFDRDVHGVVIKAETLGLARGTLRLRLWVGPSLELLSLSRRMRVFQGLTAVEIVEALVGPAFERYGGELDTTLVDDVPLRVRDYCVQQDETDLQLAQRLLAEEGIAFSFRHTEGEGTETMVLLPGTACLHSAAGEHEATRMTKLLARDPDLATEETIQSLQGASRMRVATAEASIWDWKAQSPATVSGRKDPFDQDVDLGESQARFGELHEHEPYRPVEETEGGPLFEQVELEADRFGQIHRVDDLRARGAGNVLGFTDGATFEVEQHPSPHLEGKYALLSVTHHAEFHDADEGVAEGQVATYGNHFTCHRFAAPDVEVATPFVPPRRDKPRAAGPVTATVVGPEGEEIHTDEHGRIKVRMHWDREGLARGDHETSCWVAVGQLWGGPGFGAVFIPRVGMEAVISFLAGDPDRPLCTGVVYNGGNRPPYPLPEHKTRTVLRTSSSPGGDGHNELSFEDAAGSEEVFLKAQRNLREAVGANQSTNVGANQTVNVGGHRKKTIKGFEETTVDDYQLRTVKSDSCTIIWGGEKTRVRCGAAKGKQFAASGTSTLSVEGERLVDAEKIELMAMARGASAVFSTLTMLDKSVELVTPELFRIKVGAGAVFEITPTEATLTVDTIKLQSKTSTITMDGDSAGVTIEGQDIVELRKGKDDACCLSLDGDATLKGADVEVGATGDAKLKGMSAIIEAAKEASVNGKQKTQVSSGGNLDLQAGGVLSQLGTLLKLGS